MDSTSTTFGEGTALPRLRSLRRTFIGRNHKANCHPHARRYDKQGGCCCDVYENP